MYKRNTLTASNATKYAYFIYTYRIFMACRVKGARKDIFLLWTPTCQLGAGDKMFKGQKILMCKSNLNKPFYFRMFFSTPGI